jgi:2'-5' RNA ligase
MKNTTHKTAVVIIPPQETRVPIQAIRQKHDRKVGWWMPHITLIYPFVPKSEFNRVARELLRACKSVSPFDVTLARFDAFAHGKGHHIVWLAPEPADPVLDLHAALWSVVCEDEDLESGLRHFRPHLSVGQVRGTANAATLVEELRANWSPVRFRVDSVHFIWRGEPPDDVFRVDRSLQLQGR